MNKAVMLLCVISAILWVFCVEAQLIRLASKVSKLESLNNLDRGEKNE